MLRPLFFNPPDTEAELDTLNAGAPAADRDTHGRRVRRIAGTAARLAGLFDPDAHAERATAAFLRDVLTYRPGQPAAFHPGDGDGRAVGDNADEPHKCERQPASRQRTGKLAPAVPNLWFDDQAEEAAVQNQHYRAPRLGEGGEEGDCGWLEDRYGVSWQIIPTAVNDMISHSDPDKSQRAMQAMPRRLGEKAARTEPAVR